MSIQQLIEAAEWIERREREAEHGYASTLPIPEDFTRRRMKSKKSHGHGNRSSHNELEKNRRAHLRTCLEQLKRIVPVGPDASRHTTLGLLTKAKHHIKQLEDKERRNRHMKDQLSRDQRYLRRRLEQLTNGQYGRLRVERSYSECSSGSSTTNSTSSISSSPDPSEPDEVDILGYGSTSDTDDHSSIQSNSSDGGCAVTTRRMRLSESL